MWELLEAAVEVLGSATLDAALDEAPRSVRIGCTVLTLVPVIALFGWAVWGLLK